MLNKPRDDLERIEIPSTPKKDAAWEDLNIDKTLSCVWVNLG